MADKIGTDEYGEILIYQTDDGQTNIEVKIEDDTVWLTQQQLTKLYQCSKSNISEYIKHIFEEGELVKDSVVRKFRTTADEGKNIMLLITISLGYRIKSVIATRFRQWVDFTKPEDEETFRMQNEMMYKKMEQEEIPFISWTISVSCKKIAGSIDVLEQSVKRKPYYGMVIKYLINSINKSIAIDD